MGKTHFASSALSMRKELPVPKVRWEEKELNCWGRDRTENTGLDAFSLWCCLLIPSVLSQPRQSRGFAGTCPLLSVGAQGAARGLARSCFGSQVAFLNDRSSLRTLQSLPGGCRSSLIILQAAGGAGLGEAVSHCPG